MQICKIRIRIVTKHFIKEFITTITKKKRLLLYQLY